MLNVTDSSVGASHLPPESLNPELMPITSTKQLCRDLPPLYVG